MLKTKVFFILLLSLVFFIPPLLSQENVPKTDTSYFLSYDDNFNLIMAANRGDLGIVEMLLNRGANINAVTIDGVSALMYAAENGDLDMVRLLLANEANPNLKPFNGMTALISAVRNGYFLVAEYLITHGAQPDIRDTYGATALNYASAYNYPDMVEMLVYYDADINLADFKGNTPLISAAYNNSLQAAQILLENEAGISIPNKKGNTPLMAAVQKGQHEMIQLLLANGADLDETNKGGATPLAFAVKKGDYDLTLDLISSGADINHQLNNSRNILEIARINNNDKIYELLRSKGATPNRLPDFSRFIAGTELSFNSEDFMIGFNAGIQDIKYNFGAYGGFAFRPSAIRILTPESEKLSYQYWERRYFFHLDLEKKFALINLDEQFNTGPLVKVREIYTFGSYRGSDSHPQRRFITAPSAGWYLMNPWMDIYFNYEYLDFEVEGLDPGRFVFGLNFRFSLRKKSLSDIEIKWLEEEE